MLILKLTKARLTRSRMLQRVITLIPRVNVEGCKVKNNVSTTESLFSQRAEGSRRTSVLAEILLVAMEICQYDVKDHV